MKNDFENSHYEQPEQSEQLQLMQQLSFASDVISTGDFSEKYGKFLSQYSDITLVPQQDLQQVIQSELISSGMSEEEVSRMIGAQMELLRNTWETRARLYFRENKTQAIRVIDALNEPIQDQNQFLQHMRSKMLESGMTEEAITHYFSTARFQQKQFQELHTEHLDHFKLDENIKKQFFDSLVNEIESDQSLTLKTKEATLQKYQEIAEKKILGIPNNALKYWVKSAEFDGRISQHIEVKAKEYKEVLGLQNNLKKSLQELSPKFAQTVISGLQRDIPKLVDRKASIQFYMNNLAGYQAAFGKIRDVKSEIKSRYLNAKNKEEYATLLTEYQLLKSNHLAQPKDFLALSTKWNTLLGNVKESNKNYEARKEHLEQIDTLLHRYKLPAAQTEMIQKKVREEKDPEKLKELLSILSSSIPEQSKAHTEASSFDEEFRATLKGHANEKEYIQKLDGFKDLYGENIPEWKSKYMATAWLEDLKNLFEEFENDEQDKKEKKRKKEKQQDTKDENESIDQENLDEKKEKILEQQIKTALRFSSLPEAHKATILENMTNINIPLGKREQFRAQMEDFIRRESMYIRLNTTTRSNLDKQISALGDKGTEFRMQLASFDRRYEENLSRWDYEYLAKKYGEDLKKLEKQLVQFTSTESQKSKRSLTEKHMTRDEKMSLQNNAEKQIQQFSNVPKKHRDFAIQYIVSQEYTFEEAQVYIEKHLLPFFEQESKYLDTKNQIRSRIGQKKNKLSVEQQREVTSRLHRMDSKYKDNLTKWEVQYLGKAYQEEMKVLEQDIDTWATQEKKVNSEQTIQKENSETIEEISVAERVKKLELKNIYFPEKLLSKLSEKELIFLLDIFEKVPYKATYSKEKHDIVGWFQTVMKGSGFKKEFRRWFNDQEDSDIKDFNRGMREKFRMEFPDFDFETWVETPSEEEILEQEQSQQRAEKKEQAFELQAQKIETASREDLLEKLEDAIYEGEVILSEAGNIAGEFDFSSLEKSVDHGSEVIQEKQAGSFVIEDATSEVNEHIDFADQILTSITSQIEEDQKIQEEAEAQVLEEEYLAQTEALELNAMEVEEKIILTNDEESDGENTEENEQNFDREKAKNTLQQEIQAAERLIIENNADEALQHHIDNSKLLLNEETWDQQKLELQIIQLSEERKRMHNTIDRETQKQALEAQKKQKESNEKASAEKMLLQSLQSIEAWAKKHDLTEDEQEELTYSILSAKESIDRTELTADDIYAISEGLESLQEELSENLEQRTKLLALERKKENHTEDLKNTLKQSAQRQLNQSAVSLREKSEDISLGALAMGTALLLAKKIESYLQADMHDTSTTQDLLQEAENFENTFVHVNNPELIKQAADNLANTEAQEAEDEDISMIEEDASSEGLIDDFDQADSLEIENKEDESLDETSENEILTNEALEAEIFDQEANADEDHENSEDNIDQIDTIEDNEELLESEEEIEDDETYNEMFGALQEDSLETGDNDALAFDAESDESLETPLDATSEEEIEGLDTSEEETPNMIKDNPEASIDDTEIIEATKEESLDMKEKNEALDLEEKESEETSAVLESSEEGREEGENNENLDQNTDFATDILEDEDEREEHNALRLESDQEENLGAYNFIHYETELEGDQETSINTNEQTQETQEKEHSSIDMNLLFSLQQLLITTSPDADRLDESTLRLVMRIVEEKSNISDVSKKLSEALAGMPSESITTMISAIIGQYFGNEALRSWMSEQEKNIFGTSLRDVILVISYTALSRNIPFRSIIDPALLDTRVSFVRKELLPFQSQLSTTSPLTLRAKAEGNTIKLALVSQEGINLIDIAKI